MTPSLILVDGLTIANRPPVAAHVLSKFEKDSVELFKCDDETPPHLFVPMMANVWMGKSVIIENSWRCHQVLRAIGQPTRFQPELMRMLDRIALGCNAHIALAVSRAPTVEKRWNELQTGRDYPHKEVADFSLAWLYADTHGLYQQLIRTDDATFTDDVDILMDHVMLSSRATHGPGIGAWNPDHVVLLVGDRHGPSIQPYAVDYNLAFCDMAKAGSSFWLSQQLDKANVQEKHLYWINAYDKEDIPTEPGFIEQLKPVAICALGDRAARWCQSNSLRYEHFTHPQYHKRFEHSQPYPLIEFLAKTTKEL